MKKSVNWFLFCGIISGLTACNLPAQVNPGAISLNNVPQYQTVSALLTKTSQVNGGSETGATPTFAPGQAVTPTSTSPLTPSALLSPLAMKTQVKGGVSMANTGGSTTALILTKTPQAACDVARPGHPIDVTIPDESVFHPGDTFSKTWRIVNAGTCAWDQQYSVVWFSGDNLGLSHTLPLSERVEPGDSIDITVDMHAPQEPGLYQSNWKLSNSQGSLFGIGPDGEAPFWVRIMVIPLETPTASSARVTPEATLAPSATPAVFSAGSLQLMEGSGADLDTGQLNQTDNDDILFEGVSGANTMSSLVPQNGAQISLFGVLEPQLENCLQSVLEENPVAYDQLYAGAYLCYRTDQGLPGRILVDAVDADQGQIGLSYLTWQVP